MRNLSDIAVRLSRLELLLLPLQIWVLLNPEQLRVIILQMLLLSLFWPKIALLRFDLLVRLIMLVKFLGNKTSLAKVSWNCWSCSEAKELAGISSLLPSGLEYSRLGVL
jgi:hypothetical protein